jgi:hypothetical protein
MPCQVESVELRAAFIVRVQMANTIGFHIIGLLNTAMFHYILTPVYTCNFCPSSATSLRQAVNISIVIEIYRNSLHAIFQKL